MGSQKCRIVGKSQSVLIVINPIIFTRTRSCLVCCCAESACHGGAVREGFIAEGGKASNTKGSVRGGGSAGEVQSAAKAKYNYHVEQRKHGKWGLAETSALSTERTCTVIELCADGSYQFERWRLVAAGGGGATSGVGEEGEVPSCCTHGWPAQDATSLCCCRFTLMMFCVPSLAFHGR
jgi:hypothetical protein